MSWDKIKFADLYSIESRNGLTKPSKVRGSGYKMINMGELFSNDRIYDISMELVPLTEREKTSSRIEKGDLLFARQSLVLEGAGKCSIVMDASPLTVFESHLIRVRLDQSKANPLFYYYYFKSPQSPIKTIVSQCAQSGIRGSDLSELCVAFPKLEIQNHIADILSAYDDLIENNQKQIKLLEEAAQRLYKEWFVDLRFPGYENTPIVDGVPEGWEQKTVEECLAFHGNGGWGKETPTGKNTYPGKVIRGTDINDIKNGHFGDMPTRYHSDNDIKSRTLKQYDLVFELSNGNINNIGRCLFIDDLILKNCGENTICASFCKLLRPLDELHALILYLEIQDMQMSGRMLPLKKHGANGINNFDFEGFLLHALLIPKDTDIVESLKTIMKKISIIQGEITLLIKARDRLLPKLMSGEIDFSEKKHAEILQLPQKISYEEFLAELGMAARAKTISEADLKAMYEAYLDDDATE